MPHKEQHDQKKGSSSIVMDGLGRESDFRTPVRNYWGNPIQMWDGLKESRKVVRMQLCEASAAEAIDLVVIFSLG